MKTADLKYIYSAMDTAFTFLKEHKDIEDTPQWWTQTHADAMAVFKEHPDRMTRLFVTAVYCYMGSVNKGSNWEKEGITPENLIGL